MKGVVLRQQNFGSAGNATPSGSHQNPLGSALRPELRHHNHPSDPHLGIRIYIHFFCASWGKWYDNHFTCVSCEQQLLTLIQAVGQICSTNDIAGNLGQCLTLVEKAAAGGAIVRYYTLCWLLYAGKRVNGVPIVRPVSIRRRNEACWCTIST